MSQTTSLAVGSCRSWEGTLALVGSLVLCAGWASAVRGAQAPEMPDKLKEIRRLVDSGDWKRADELVTAVISQNSTSYEAYEVLGRVKDAPRGPTCAQCC